MVIFQFGVSVPFEEPSGRNQAFYKAQFENEVVDAISSARAAERQYRQVEKILKGLFPEDTRRSPFFLSVERDFWTYRQSVKKLNDTVLNLAEARKDYARLFSRGLLRSVDVIAQEDDGWETARNLALSLEQNLDVARTELEHMDQAYETFSSFEQEIEGVMETSRDLESTVKSLDRNVSRWTVEWETMIRQFGTVDTTLKRFTLYTRADSIRRLLEETIETLDVRMDSLTSLADRLDYLLAGVAVSGDENRVRDLYRSVDNERSVLPGEVEEYLEKGEKWGRELGNALNLLETVRKMVADMDEALAQLSKREEEVTQAWSVDSLRMTSLMSRSRDSASLNRPPYPELKDAYQEVAAFVNGLERLVVDVVTTRQQIIEASAEMISPDDLELDELREAKKTFDQTWELYMDQADRLDRVHEDFNLVILENFVNTPEYWDIQYMLVERKNDRGETIVEENYGYLYDAHAYPGKPYHGQLVSELQFRLRKEERGASGEGHFFFVFEGSGPVGAEDIILMDGDSIVFQASKDDAAVWKETARDRTVQFEWIIPVGRSMVRTLTRTEHLVLRVHHLTLTHQVNLTLFKKGLYRDYGIPKERVNRWAVLLEEGPTSQPLFIGPPFYVPGTVGHLFSGLLLDRHAIGSRFSGWDGRVGDDTGGESGGMPIYER
ncbi:MAG: hypothetical protein ACE5HZ_02815 [Fidelibacterota bacterium]